MSTCSTYSRLVKGRLPEPDRALRVSNTIPHKTQVATTVNALGGRPTSPPHHISITKDPLTVARRDSFWNCYRKWFPQHRV